MAEVVAEGVVRLGTPLVNWYLVEDGGRVTVVDAGLPKYRPQLEEGLRLLGRSKGDVAAIILTHAHGDHVGVAEALRRELGVPVYVHEGDKSLAQSQKRAGKNEASVFGYLRFPFAWKLLAHFVSAGKPKPITEVQTFGAHQTLDVPGSPHAIHTPGHTDGHTVFLFEEHGVMFLGDLLCTLNPLTGRKGPQLLPRALNKSSQEMLDSLGKLGAADGAVLHFGHGEPWSDGAAAAVERARATGPT
jgi:glyoxylase-like metal-dependent hydrolase (beta-lactamase superfamily II)